MKLSGEAAKLLGQIKEGSDAALRAWHGGGLAVTLLRELFSAEGDDYDVQYFLAGYPETPSRILEELSGRCEAATILALLAENIRTPKPILQQLAKHERVEVRKAVAAGRGISPQVALLLCDDPDAQVRAVLAENPSVTPRVQVRLSEDPVPFVRAALLKNGKLDEEIQFALCDDIDVAVQAKALLAPRTSENCLLRVADGDDSLSQRLLLMRSQLPESVLESLLFSQDDQVKREAVNRKSLTDDEMVGLARGRDEAIRLKLAGTAGLPAIVQMVLAGDSSMEVRTALAGSGGLSAEAVTQLVACNDGGIDLALAANSDVPLSSLADVLDRNGAEGLCHAACRPKLTEDDVRWLAEHGDENVLYQLWYRGAVLKNVDGTVLRKLVAHSLPSIRSLAARSGGLTIAMMAELCQDASPLVRLELARNPETLASFLKVLVEDKDAHVAKAASASLTAQEAAEAEDVEEVEEEGRVADEGDMGGSPGEKDSPEDAPGGAEASGAHGLFRRFIAKLGGK